MSPADTIRVPSTAMESLPSGHHRASRRSNMDSGLAVLNAVKEPDLGRPHDNPYEAALWVDILRVQGNAVLREHGGKQAIVIPETIDAIRTMTARMRSGPLSRSARPTLHLGSAARSSDSRKMVRG